MSNDTSQQAHTFSGKTRNDLGIDKTKDAFGGKPLRKMVEIYHSVKGEGTQSGMPMVFCRFAGCNLACAWCDTPYERVSFQATDEQLLGMIMSYEPAWVVFTGGEPLMQLSMWLTDQLVAAGVKMAIESNGQMWNDALVNIDYVCFSPKRMVDAKTETKHMLSPKIIDAVKNGSLTINELRYVVESEKDTPLLVDVESEFITFSPLMLDPEPQAGFESGDGYKSRFGKVHAGAYNRCLELVNQHRHRGGRLSVQLHKFIGVR